MDSRFLGAIFLMNLKWSVSFELMIFCSWMKKIHVFWIGISLLQSDVVRILIGLLLVRALLYPVIRLGLMVTVLFYVLSCHHPQERAMCVCKTSSKNFL